MKEYYEFFCPVKIIAGNLALEHIPYELSLLGCSKPLIITDKGVVSAGLIKTLTAAFNDSSLSFSSVFDEVPPDSSLTVVNNVAAMYRSLECDSIIAVGGGSVIDTAKGVNIVVSENADDLMKFTGAGALKRPLRPFLVIPTTAGTGSEVTLVAVIANQARNCKMLFTSHFLLPNIAVLDPRMTLTLPPLLTAATGMDAFTHAVEAYTCLGKNPLSDPYAITAVKLIQANLVYTVKNPSHADGRLALAQASTMAGIAFSNSMVGLVHSIGHTIGALFHLPNVTALSILLPHVLNYNLTKGNAQMRTNIGELLVYTVTEYEYLTTTRERRAERFIEKITEMKEELFRLAKLPRTLRETGKVAREQLQEIAHKSINDASIIYNPVEADATDILAILEKAF